MAQIIAKTSPLRSVAAAAKIAEERLS